MGQTVRERVIVLSVMLTAVCLITNWNWSACINKFDPSISLNEVLSEIPNWRRSDMVSLELPIIEALQLDDYANYVYLNGNEKVFLYIGQYFSNQQVGAAHDPMVCFPGQGWNISQRTKGRVSVTSGFKNHSVSYSSMVTELNEQKNLVVYWFQANESTHGDTLSQKIASLWNVFTGRSHSNSFVRITTALEDDNVQAGKIRIFQFINDFYPIYFNYSTSESLTANK